MLGHFSWQPIMSHHRSHQSGKIIYGILLGILTGLFRLFGANAEGVSFAIILGNLLVPIIEKHTILKAFGVKKEGKSMNKKKIVKDAMILTAFTLVLIAGLDPRCGQ